MKTEQPLQNSQENDSIQVTLSIKYKDSKNKVSKLPPIKSLFQEAIGKMDSAKTE